MSASISSSAGPVLKRPTLPATPRVLIFCCLLRVSITDLLSTFFRLAYRVIPFRSLTVLQNARTGTGPSFANSSTAPCSSVESRKTKVVLPFWRLMSAIPKLRQRRKLAKFKSDVSNVGRVFSEWFIIPSSLPSSASSASSSERKLWGSHLRRNPCGAAPPLDCDLLLFREHGAFAAGSSHQFIGCPGSGRRIDQLRCWASDRVATGTPRGANQVRNAGYRVANVS